MENFKSSENSSEQSPVDKVESLQEKASTLIESEAWSDAHIALCEAQNIVKKERLGEELYNQLNSQLDDLEALMAAEKQEKLRIQREEQAAKPNIAPLEKQSTLIDSWSDVAAQEFGYEVITNEDGVKFVENKKDGLRISMTHTTTTGIATISSIDHPENSSNITFSVSPEQDMKTVFENVLSKFEARYEQDQDLSQEDFDDQVRYEEKQDQIAIQEAQVDKGLAHQQAIEAKTKEILDLMKGEGESPKE